MVKRHIIVAVKRHIVVVVKRHIIEGPQEDIVDYPRCRIFLASLTLLIAFTDLMHLRTVAPGFGHIASHTAYLYIQIDD